MPPRGRPRKRLGRMDAAVDAMRPLGFTAERVRKRVKELLKEYGGDDGWPFIEDSSYTELLDALLCDVEEKNQEKIVPDGNQMKGKSCSDGEPSGICTRASDTQQDERPRENAPSEIIPVAEPTSPEPVRSISETNNDGKSWKDILPDQTSEHVEEAAILVSKSDEDLPTDVHSPRNSLAPASPPLSSIPFPPPNRSRRRLHYYGWIEGDEEGDDDFIFLGPASGVLGAEATLPRELSKCVTDVKRKRRSRWDEKPDDP